MAGGVAGGGGGGGVVAVVVAVGGVVAVAVAVAVVVAVVVVKRTALTRTAFGAAQKARVQGEARKRSPHPPLPSTWPASFMTEKAFQADVESKAAALGWWTSHSHLPFFDTAGWPDLALVHPGKKRFMVRELKVTSVKGKVGAPTPTQWRWLTALAEAGVDTGVWTWPFDDDRLVEELLR